MTRRTPQDVLEGGRWGWGGGGVSSLRSPHSYNKKKISNSRTMSVFQRNCPNVKIKDTGPCAKNPETAAPKTLLVGRGDPSHKQMNLNKHKQRSRVKEHRTNLTT